ncbi:BNR-4 repeat-containing protein [Marinoscillum furvescens]|uniref:Putative BNR repeat neuraminidase n=1 Tax=Marinoscillum furvescens DSM 4134 TaxID=1122208 RepID=A0A3D9L8K9_MARFU|nr:BNR-4 repeat-containing protein [Marinoscillum furvescens]REE02024.1 putative BNR repeat neuraminidase [Marinoscillum furvescens DSM 4134]
MNWKTTFRLLPILMLVAGACSKVRRPMQLPDPHTFTYEGNAIEGLETDTRTDPGTITANVKDTGYRGIWDHNQPLDNEYKYKYSGGLATYTAKHRPLAIYSPEAQKTFFTYGGAAPSNNERLWHMVSYFDHKTGTVPRPTILLDKLTGDAHDNPVISIDDDGYIWIFSTAHGSWRPAYIHKSKKPYSIDSFELIRPVKMENGQEVPMDNFSYFQPWHLKYRGFLAFFSSYSDAGGTIVGPHGNPAQRTLVFATSKNGSAWSEWQTIGAIGEGHYPISTQNGEKAGVAFNYHPRKKLPEQGLNYRTNLYYMETDDFGNSWKTVGGQPLETPLTDVNSPALVKAYEADSLLVYMKDMVYDAAGNPAILYLTSRGYESGPDNDPRTWRLAKWNGEKWLHSQITTSDHNYDMGSIYTEREDRWVVMAPTLKGAQAYNPGGEVGMYVSTDQGESWQLERALTSGSAYNHTYVRKPLNAHPDFYAFWADGHAREVSKSRLYYADKQGSVYGLPEYMEDDEAKPQKLLEDPLDQTPIANEN